MTQNQPTSILIVDDTPENLRLLTQMLSRHDYKTRVATNGERALDSVQANPPDLMMLDVMMPGLNGFEVCERLKADPQTRDIPVIFISALNNTADKIRAFEVGGVDYVTKPFETQEVLARLDTHLTLHRLQQQLKEKVAQLDATNAQLHQEIAMRIRTEGALWQSKEHFRTVADFTYNWEYWLGPTGHIIYMSPACKRITGYRPEEFQRNPELLRSLAHPDDQIEWTTHLNHVLRNEATFELEFRIRTREGEERWIGHTCQPVYGTAGKELGRRASNRDITERVRAEMQLRDYTTQLENQNAELDAFAHTVAHDLKSPLTGLIGYSMLLERNLNALPPDEIVQQLHRFTQIGYKMADIIDALLLLASVRQMAEIERAPLDMGAIVQQAQTRLQEKIAAADAELIQPETWPAAVGYAPWIEEVWVNYLSNALKYGGRPEEDIPPRVVLGYDTAPAHQLRFWVRDNGAGLTSEAQAQLFTEFTRLEKERAEGHGLGLSIVRRIVEKLGGAVGVTSELGTGSTFWFTLPAAKSAD
ncbi:MAG: response regulator [Anaerolineales bacterium]